MDAAQLDTTPTSSEPAPLRVIKRRSGQIRGSDNASELSSLSSRRTSGYAEESVGNVPEHPGWGRPLTVRKKRQQPFSPCDSPNPALRPLRPERSYMMLPRANERDTTRMRSNGGLPSISFPSPIKEVSDAGLTAGLDGYVSPAQYSYDGPGSVPPSPFPIGYGHAYQAQLNQNAFVLVPHISVTPETRAVEDGSSIVWLAVEVTGQVCQSSNSQPAFSHHTDGLRGYEFAGPDPFRYGLLFDMTVDIQPLGGSTIMDLLQDDPIPTTLYAGSTILILVHIHLRPQSPSAASSISVSRQPSDELMEDLEYRLGSSHTDYLSIRLTYAHTAFPQLSPSMPSFDGSGVTSCQTRLETTATACLKRHDRRSPWSPHPVPAPNPLFDVVTAHWPPDRAANAIHRMLTRHPATHRPAPPRQFSARGDRLSDYSRSRSPVESPCDGRKTAPPGHLRVPRRETSLAKNATVRRPEEARTSWTDIRRASGGGPRGRARLSPVEPGPTGEAAGASETTLRSRTSAAASTLDGSLTPSVTGTLRVENASCRESGKGVKPRKGGQVAARRDSGRGKSDGGRWSWTNWW